MGVCGLFSTYSAGISTNAEQPQLDLSVKFQCAPQAAERTSKAERRCTVHCIVTGRNCSWIQSHRPPLESAQTPCEWKPAN